MASLDWPVALGLLIALLGPMAWLGWVRRANGNTLTLAARGGLWIIMLLVFCLVYFAEGRGASSMGFKPIGWTTILVAVATLGSLIAVFALSTGLAKLLGGTPVISEVGAKAIHALPLLQKVFVIATAGVVEEVLFRGYSIERIEPLIGSAWLAGAVTLAMFVVNHLGAWSPRHLISVLAAGSVLTVAYIVSRDLVACIIAHVSIDMIGFIAMPMLMAKRRARA